MKKQEWFKEKSKKDKELKPMKIAKDALVLTGGLLVIGAGASLLGGLVD